jgi:hypothetical protein
VIALIMFGLLGGSLGLAKVVTGVPLRPPAAVEPRVVTFGKVSLNLPAAWSGESMRRPQPGVTEWNLTNGQSVGERLRVLRVRTSTPAEPGQLLGSLVVAPQRAEGRVFLVSPGESAMMRRYADEAVAEGTLDLTFSTRRLTRTATSPQLNAVRLMAVSPREFWVFQLTDQVTIEAWRRHHRALEMGQLEQLRRLLEGMTRVEPVV